MLLLLACADDSPSADDNAVASLSPNVQTQIVVRCETAAGQRVEVEFGETEDYGFITPPTVGVTHRSLLRGMPSNTDVHWRLLVDGVAGVDHVTTTGLLPADLSIPELRYDDATWTGFLVVPMVGAWQGIVVLDPHGRVVWYYEPGGENLAAVRAAPLQNGRGIAFNLKAYDGASGASLEKVSWDGEPIQSIDVPRIAHDFLEVEQDTFAVLQSIDQTVDAETYTGERLVEIGEDGRATEIWSAFDSWDPLTVGDNSPAGWTHANALNWDAERGEYQIGFRELDSIVRLDRATGELTAAMAGAANDGWSFVDIERPFQYQHQFDLSEDQLLVFDNGLAATDATRVVEYAVDEQAKTLTQVWSYGFEPEQWVLALGDVERLSDGSTLIAWGVGGRMQQVTANGETLWQIEAPVGDGFGYMTHVSTLY